MDIKFSDTAKARLAPALLAQAAERHSTAAASTLVGVVLVAYLHWDGPGQMLLPLFVLARLLTIVYARQLARRILALRDHGHGFMHLEPRFVLALGAGGAAWGIVGWMVLGLDVTIWPVRNVFSALLLVFVSSVMLITLAHHRRALLAHICAQWLVILMSMAFKPDPLKDSLLIVVGILAMLAVLLLYGRMLLLQTEAGVLAELRNEDLTERLRRTNAELEKALDQAVDAASHDALTGALNRRALYARADYLLASRRRSDWPGAVLLLDLDHFKSINDGYGHAAGDAVLKALADMLRSELRELDVVARWGGEEFLVLMPDCDTGSALLRAEELRASVARMTVPALPPGRRVTVSIGAADWPDGADLDAVIGQADAALYQAKEAGRNRVMLST